MQRYNKLVRDKIPQILCNSGSDPGVRVLKDTAEYRQALRDKLIEETQELYGVPPNKGMILDEFADVLEVLEALRISFGLTEKEIEETRKKKVKEKGAFSQKFFLETA